MHADVELKIKSQMVGACFSGKIQVPVQNILQQYTLQKYCYRQVEQTFNGELTLKLGVKSSVWLQDRDK